MKITTAVSALFVRTNRESLFVPSHTIIDVGPDRSVMSFEVKSSTSIRFKHVESCALYGWGVSMCVHRVEDKLREILSSSYDRQPLAIVRITPACHSDWSELHVEDRKTSNGVPSSDEECLCPLVGFSTKKEIIYSPVCISSPCGWF